MASIKMRKNRDEQRIFDIRVKISGKVYCKAYPAKNEPPIPSTWSDDKARKAADRVAVLFENECRGGMTSKDKRTLAEYAEYVVGYKLASENIKPTTAEGYKHLLKRIKAATIGSMKMTDIQARNLNEFYQSLLADGQNQKTGGKLSAKTIREYHALISSVFSQAAKEGVVIRNVAVNAMPPKVSHREADCYTPDQIATILDAIQNDTQYWRAMTYVFIGSGARRSEVNGLQWSDIDFENNRIRFRLGVTYTSGEPLHIGTPKTGRENTLTMPVEVMNELRAWRMEQEKLRGVLSLSGFVFSLEDPNTPIHPDSITKHYRDLGKRCGFNLHPHAFRHTQASIILQSGDVVAASLRLGHAQKSTTLNIYGHMMPNKDKQASDLVANTLFNSKTKQSG